MSADSLEVQRRFEKQLAMPEIGAEGQARLMEAKVAIIGCGALGCAQADLLARAGVGAIALVDPDVVDVSNLHRQILFDQDDAVRRRFKVDAAKERLDAVKSGTRVDAFRTLATAENLPELVAGAQLVLDATDLVSSRRDIDAACRHLGLPWIYGGVMGTRGTVMCVPAGSPCLSCLFGGLPDDPDERTAWRRHGHMGPTVLMTASLQVSLAVKFIARNAMERELMAFDLWSPSLFRMSLSGESKPGCGCKGLC